MGFALDWGRRSFTDLRAGFSPILQYLDNKKSELLSLDFTFPTAESQL